MEEVEDAGVAVRGVKKARRVKGAVMMAVMK